jgi:hypothetical protein
MVLLSSTIMEPVKPEPVLPQVFEYGGENIRATEYSDSHHLQTLTGSRTPSVEVLEMDGARAEPRRDQVWYEPAQSPGAMARSSPRN